MLTPMIKLLVVGCLFGIFAEQTVQAQYRGRGGGDRGDSRSRFGGRDRDGNDRDRDEMRRRFEEMRSRFGGGDRGGSDRDRGDMRRRFGGGDRDDDDRRDSDRSRSDRSRSGNDRRSDRSQPSFYVPKPHDPIGLELPGNYAGADTNGDGQIALLEWRQSRPQEIARFMIIDTNKDGFLTARELVIAENFPDETAAAPEVIAAYSSGQRISTSASTAADGEGNTDETASAAEAEASYVFNALDKDRDGKISADEWGKSKSVREGFDKAGITLTTPADLPSFLNQYPPYRIVPQLRLPSSR